MDAATGYAERVVARKTLAGPHVRAACARHLKDLERAGKRGFPYHYDETLAAEAGAFFEEVLVLTGGVHEGAPFKLLPWQAFIVHSLHGWVSTKTGFRRFRRAYIETAKGSGKSPLAAGLGLKALCADGEPRAEVYVVAVTSDQALITFRFATAMAETSPALRERLTITGGAHPYNLAHHDSMSFMRRMSSTKTAKGKSGVLTHMLLVDEYHEHPDTAMHDFFAFGIKNKRQPLILIITNAGVGLTSACGLEHQRALAVAHGDRKAESYFSFVCSHDDDDDPFHDPKCWRKSNPSLPALPGQDYLREQVELARGMPSKRSLVARLNFCIWEDAEAPWLDRDRWMRCERKKLLEKRLDELPCAMGADLSLKTDLTAISRVWYDAENDLLLSRTDFWTPLDTLHQRKEQDQAPYDVWLERGYLHAPPGAVIDFDFLAAWIAEQCARYKVEGFAFDPMKIDLLVAALDKVGVRTTRDESGDGLLIMPHPQGFKAGTLQDDGKRRLFMPRSIDALEARIANASIRIEHNPVLRWGALGLTVIADASGNRRVTKTKSIARIDGMVALLQAVGLAESLMNTPAQPIAHVPIDFYT